MVPPERRNTVPERAADYRGNPASSQPGAVDLNALIQLQIMDMLDRKGNGGGKGPRDIELTERSMFRVDFRTVLVIVAIALAWADMRNTMTNLKIAQDSYKETQAAMQREARLLSKEFEDLRLSLVSNGIKVKLHETD